MPKLKRYLLIIAAVALALILWRPLMGLVSLLVSQ